MKAQKLIIMVGAWAATLGIGYSRAAWADVAVRVVRADAHVDSLDCEVNEQVDRVRLVPSIVDGTFDSEKGPTSSGPAPTAVQGLAYRPGNKSIVFAESGHDPVECARVVSKHFLFFHWTKVQPTGRCGITRIAERVDPASLEPDHERRTDHVIYFGRTR